MKQTVNFDRLSTIPGLTPPADQMLASLLEGAVRGTVEVYYGEVRPGCIVPFSPDYDPEAHPAGRAAIADIMDRWRKNEFTMMWLYERDGCLVMSDDYIIWAAIKKGRPDLVPAYILGKPSASLTTNLRGPLNGTAVKQALGFA